MDKLPITNNDYDKAILITNFIQEFKFKANDAKDIEKIVFSPKIGGYDISFTCYSIPCSITLSVDKSKFTSKMKVEYIKGKEKSKVYETKNEEENREIISRIFADVLIVVE